MKLITKEVQKKLDDNMKLPEEERQPVVKFFGGGGCSWFISERDDNILFGLCDLGVGYREFGTVHLSELEELKFPPFGLGVERDLQWTPQTFDELLEEHKQNGGW